MGCMSLALHGDLKAGLAAFIEAKHILQEQIRETICPMQHQESKGDDRPDQEEQFCSVIFRELVHGVWLSK